MSIFEKRRLRPSQFRTVADRRFGDANALRDTGENARANGAMYLGGFVIECLLKAKLVEKHPWLQNAGSPEGRPDRERRLWSLCYRSHDLVEILANLPSIIGRLTELEERKAVRLVQWLRTICASWTVHARYSPQSADIDDARKFLDRIEEIKPWLA
jgi:hypothetical protein